MLIRLMQLIGESLTPTKSLIQALNNLLCMTSEVVNLQMLEHIDGESHTFLVVIDGAQHHRAAQSITALNEVITAQPQRAENAVVEFLMGIVVVNAAAERYTEKPFPGNRVVPKIDTVNSGS